MRLTCPNCGAQYEVPEDVIPPEGRDVQCSNCGDTWFQLSAEALAAEQEQNAPEAEMPIDAAAEERPKRAIDPQVSQILREEAEREAALRSAPEGSLETQTEMGLEDTFDPEGSPKPAAPADEVAAADPAAAAPEPDVEDPAAPDSDATEAPEVTEVTEPSDTSGAVQVADPAEHAAVAAAVQGLMQSEDKPELKDPAPAPAPFGGRTRRSTSRRDLLPDIEDVSQDLSGDDTMTHSGAAEDTVVAAKQRSGGFRSGFVLMLLLMGIAVFVYAQAPDIADVLPEADSALTTYVSWVDGLRLWLDDLVRGLSAEA
ncbi:family finger-like domain protein [Tritonibacter multivorans]|uniref:Family finger-like domain protein n=1 Tax=Tritonibacter multivorans TaxID=928856 RepID=A0A0P1G2T9_9RHOB|nr:zinc-ribbon domain-containing protein [Tritonibacter multivorans]MDA7419693.1 zinc-ribbon domain-containing protein [Tritonibacter multivorans]CUH75992.1 family finger-like domain protein [Tritonibacter multivorans]SFC57410.1 MJ0042 family finger-like domain-containing protein [Tritonibacter multivorans]